MTSFQAEAFGICSILKSVCHLFEPGQGDLPPLKLVCDNEALVDNINKLLNQERPEFPNDTIKSDWDVIQHIRTTHQQVPMVRISWIKSHQDNGTPFDELTLPAQLNCEADELAREAHTLPQIETPMRFPGNPIQIYHHSKVITSHIKRQLRQLFKAPPLIKHICKSAAWTNAVFQTVNWPAHQRTINTSNLPNSFVTKFVHDILPTGKVIHRYKKYYDHRCPSCSQEARSSFRWSKKRHFFLLVNRIENST